MKLDSERRSSIAANGSADLLSTPGLAVVPFEGSRHQPLLTWCLLDREDVQVHCPMEPGSGEQQGRVWEGRVELD